MCDDGVAWVPIDRKTRLRDVALADMYDGCLQGCANETVNANINTCTFEYCPSRRAVDFRRCFSCAEVFVLELNSKSVLSDPVAVAQLGFGNVAHGKWNGW
jgi:hypothetical protein